MKTKTNSTKRIQELAIKYGLSHPFVRLTLHQLANTVGKTKSPPVWIKPSTKNLTDGVRLIYGTTLAAMVEESSREEGSDKQPDDKPHTPIQLHCLLPSKSSGKSANTVIVILVPEPSSVVQIRPRSSKVNGYLSTSTNGQSIMRNQNSKNWWLWCENGTSSRWAWKVKDRSLDVTQRSQ